MGAMKKIDEIEEIRIKKEKRNSDGTVIRMKIFNNVKSS